MLSLIFILKICLVYTQRLQYRSIMNLFVYFLLPVSFIASNAFFLQVRTSFFHFKEFFIEFLIRQIWWLYTLSVVVWESISLISEG